MTLSVVRSICEALDSGPEDMMTAGKVEYIPAKKVGVNPPNVLCQAESSEKIRWIHGSAAGDR